ncbi:MAG TPA: adenylate/guanylate cyclase domain-containing protein, partial [Oceanobacillus sp.]|nr:adenylate/guanylate cyclase domain-containing protein [Oceanobacillus sp.]
RDTPSHIDNPYWSHTLGNRIVLKGLPLGGLVLARHDNPFTDEERTLLEIAEKQIDSAIIQARMNWKIIQRNRELNAIYQIDRLRDHIGDENRLITTFADSLIEWFSADFTMIVLREGDSTSIRSLIDKRNLPPEVVDEIRNNAIDLDIPQIISTSVTGLILLAAPFIVGEHRIGAVIVGRNRMFTLADHRLLYAITSQMDSAVMHTRVQSQLAQHAKELEIIYRIDRIRDTETDFDVMLNRILAELMGAVSGELGFIMLFSEDVEQQLDLKVYTSEGLPTSGEFQEFIHTIARQALDSAQPVYRNHLEGAIRSVIAVPLILNERIIGVFGAMNSTDPDGFTENDKSLLLAITSQVDTAVFERLERRRIRRVLGRSVDPKVLEYLLKKANTHILEGERHYITVLYADMRDSTAWAESTSPEEFVATSNEFFSRMADVIFKYGGTLDKFVGDQVIGLFGTPIELPDHAQRAARAALEMITVHDTYQRELQQHGRGLPEIGIGLCSGEVISGEFGSPIKTEFTAMGRAMHLGARICAAAQPEQILLSHSTRELLSEGFEIRAQPPLTVKGIAEPVAIYELIDVVGTPDAQ